MIASSFLLIFPKPTITKKVKTHPPQIPNPLVQPRRKDAVDVAKDALALPQRQLPLQEAEHAGEALAGGDLEDALVEARGGADRLEADRDCFLSR